MGRIAAIINRNHNLHYDDSLGFFGFFDFVDEFDVSRHLWEKAALILRKRGCSAIRGPYNPSINDECGLLIDGFNSPPMVMMPYNSSYYANHYERLGLVMARHLYAYTISAEQQVPERILRIAARVKKSTGINVRNIQMRRLPEELKTILQLYNRTLSRNWGFVPLSFEELTAAAQDLKAIIDPSMVFIAERNGVPMGFSLCLPDINELMLECRNVQGIFRAMKFLWLLKTRRPTRARLAVLGVDPEYRNSGLASLFYSETLLRGKNKSIWGELSWIEESNKEIIRAIEIMGGKRYKTYCIWEAAL